jgi:hypothetical protein
VFEIQNSLGAFQNCSKILYHKISNESITNEAPRDAGQGETIIGYCSLYQAERRIEYFEGKLITVHPIPQTQTK